MKQHRFLISGGGTGGHIYPAISIADELSSRIKDIEIEFVGAKNRMEMKKVPENGYRITGLWISGIKRNFNLSNLLIPFKIIYSLIKSFFIIRKFNPSCVIGTGGFAINGASARHRAGISASITGDVNGDDLCL